MDRTEFVRRAKRHAKRTGQSFRFDPAAERAVMGVFVSAAALQRFHVKRLDLGCWLP